MKKIVLVTPACHFKNIGAVQRDIYSAMRLLKKMGYEVVVYTLATSATANNSLSAVALECGIEIKQFFPTHSFWKKIKNWVRHPALVDGSAEVFFQMVHSPEWNHFLSDFKPERVISFCSYSWPVLQSTRQHGIRSVFRSHNFESSFFWEELEVVQKTNPLNWVRYAAKYCGEYLAVKFADAVGALPFEQITTYKCWKKVGVHVLTLFFLPESIRPVRTAIPKKPIDLFYLAASYNIAFHRRGVELLLQKIAPRVLFEAPGEFRFHICGGKLPNNLQALCRGGISYEGYVPDLEKFLQGMDAGVFPVMTGKTMKGKVFESLARSFPLVISENCRGGYDLQDGQEVLIAKTVEEFVKKIISLKDPLVRSRLSAGAHSFAEVNFSEEGIRKTFETILA